MSDVQIQLIQKINSAKKSFLNQEDVDTKARFSCLEEFKKKLNLISNEEFLQLDVASRAMTPEFYFKNIIPALLLVVQRVIKSGQNTVKSVRCHPSGLHAVILNPRVLITEVCEVIVTSLAAGNYLFFHLSAEQERLFVKLHNLLVASGFSGECLSWIVDNNGEVKNFFYQHPAFRLVTIFDVNKEIESQLQVSDLLDRKWQIFRGGKSLAVVLSGADHKSAAKIILNSIRQGQGLLAQNISRVLVVEQEEAALKAELIEQISAVDLSFEFKNPTRSESLKQELTSEKGRSINQGSSICLFENISNCSEFHQIELQAPVCFLQSIRYGFDSIKWIQAIPNCVGVQLFGAEEKVLKISEKISATYLWKNSWIESQDFWLLGSPGSFAGHLDPNWNGSFYSNWTKF